MSLFDAIHPTGSILFRSERGGIMQGCELQEDVHDHFPDAETFSEAVMLTARVSHLRSVMEVRDELLADGMPPSGAVATRDDLEAAEQALRNHMREA